MASKLPNWHMFNIFCEFITKERIRNITGDLLIDKDWTIKEANRGRSKNEHFTKFRFTIAFVEFEQGFISFFSF